MSYTLFYTKYIVNIKLIIDIHGYYLYTNQMSLSSAIISIMYIFVLTPLFSIDFRGLKHSNCKHASYIDGFQNYLHTLIYFIHGLVWYTSEDNFVFTITLCVYFIFNMKYLADGKYGITDTIPMYLLTILGIYGLILYWEYETYVGLLSFVVHVVAFHNMSTLHKQCGDLIQIGF